MTNAVNPVGRVDLLLLQVAQELCKRHVEPRLGVEVWNAGLDRVAAEFLRSRKVPQVPISGFNMCGVYIPLDLVRVLGTVMLRRARA